MSTAVQSPAPELSPATKWQIEPRSILSRQFDLYQADEHITTLQMAVWREGCTFAIAGHEFAIRRRSLWTDGFLLLADGENVCEVRRNFWSRRFELEAVERRWILQPTGFLSTAYLLRSGEREEGRILRVAWWSRRRVAEFEHDVPPPIQVLAIFLVLIVAQRQSKAH